MSDDLRKQIFNTLNLKDTDELMKIWQANDHVEWSDKAFEVISEILQERLDHLPKQNEPVYEHLKKDFTDNFDETSPLRKFLDLKNAPALYDPKEVLWLDIWLNRAAIVAVVITVISSLFQIPSLNRLWLPYSYNMAFPPGDLVAWLIPIIIVVFGIVFQSIIVYFSLKALATILKILMEMEFSSRGVE
jgi:hypothetical protein